MTFVIGRGCAEVQIQTSVTGQFMKFVKNTHSSLTIWNILINFYIQIDIDKL